MIQDIGSHRLINAYDPDARPDAESPVFFIRDGMAAVAPRGGTLALPRAGELGENPALTYLFSVDEERFFLAESGTALPPGYAFESIRSLRKAGMGPRHLIFAAFTALQLANWYRDNRFCGTCGSPTIHDRIERAVRCTHCGRIIYPRIIPAVIVGVINGDRLLLTRYNREGRPSYQALIAGFTEIGETLEQTVEREVMEEAGLRVRNIRYYKSQPWGIADDILAGFYCDVDGDSSIRMDEQELKEAIWVPRHEIVGQPDDFSLTHEMVVRFRDGLENVPPSAVD